jgi:signal transduction histidine kinase
MGSRDGGVLQPPLPDRLTARQHLRIDVTAAAVALALTMFNAGFKHGLSFRVPDIAVALLTTAASMPAGVRRLWPLPVLTVTICAATALTALDITPISLDVTIGMAMYMVATSARRRISLAALVGSELMLASGMLLASARSVVPPDSMHTMLAAGSLWFIGDSTRMRRAYAAGLAEQAEQQQGRAAREERVRIARELHDILAHSLAVVTVRAGIGRKVMDVRPEEARLALEAVEQTGRGALDELRRIVTLLRDDDARQPSLAPAPRIEDLLAVADQVRAAGIPVELNITGDPGQLPAAVSLSVYRIVQEALTNVIKHAGPARASVRVDVLPEGVRVVVSDDGLGSSPQRRNIGRPAGGFAQHGADGMRERAMAFGGTLTTGPGPDGGFVVTAFLPATGGAP